MNYRVGNGLDVHMLKRGIPLIIGGIHIKSAYGSLGHSDGDVLLHSIVDALLGASALGDIGTFFPSNNQKWKNCQSKIFLDSVITKLNELGFVICNVDSTIILQTPCLNSHINIIRKNLSKLMKIDIDDISVKATTTDHLGFIGQKKGVVAMTSILVNRVL